MRTQFLQITGLMLGLLVSSPPAGQTDKQKPDRCKDTSHMTQAQMNDCALDNLHEAEFRLEKLLKQLGIAPNGPEQKAWEAYRLLLPGLSVLVAGTMLLFAQPAFCQR